ncbi:hypothetical protein NI17_024175 (plasmid) [Thermobifida halotolerans]|uniref:Uncharacterized protein n=2 Tax=Thermobifida halotolerans TaxID=483545 RepID=A0A399FVJ4_9ACTN|nr:hypothetical protein [Thermobifida halotolerans]UOE22264.1 hypothetical protein NI17_024175 [Thermobifida halotolerans]
MSTPAQIAARAARTRRRLLLAAAAFLVVLALVVGWLLGRAGTAQTPTASSSPQASPAPSATADTFVPLAGENLALGQYQVNYPRTPEGAVSAAIAAVQALSTNDAQALADALIVYHGLENEQIPPEDLEEEIEGFLKVRAHGIDWDRPEGTTFDREAFPAPASYFYITPIGVWWEETDSTTVRVQILATEEISDGMGLVFKRRYIHGCLMRWEPSVRSGDWVIEEARDPSRQDFYAPKEEDYTLDNPNWTPISFPEWDDSE